MVLPLIIRMLPNLLQLAGSLDMGSGVKATRGGRTTSSFRWESDTIAPNLAGAHARAHAFLRQTTEMHALRTETYAKSNAKWRDRTGNARSSLRGTPDTKASPSGGTYEITISHGMPYGIWLELRRGGHLGIINDAIRTESVAFFRTAETTMGRMFGPN